MRRSDRIVADGVAADDDPRTKATQTLPCFSTREVVGIDVLMQLSQHHPRQPALKEGRAVHQVQRDEGKGDADKGEYDGLP